MDRRLGKEDLSKLGLGDRKGHLLKQKASIQGRARPTPPFLHSLAVPSPPRQLGLLCTPVILPEVCSTQLPPAILRPLPQPTLTVSPNPSLS